MRAYRDVCASWLDECAKGRRTRILVGLPDEAWVNYGAMRALKIE